MNCMKDFLLRRLEKIDEIIHKSAIIVENIKKDINKNGKRIIGKNKIIRN